MLGDSADKIEVLDRFLIECNERGWWRAYCTDCGQNGSSPTREDLVGWIDVHAPHCHPDPDYS